MQFIKLYMVDVTFKPSCDNSNEYFPVIFFIMRYYVVLTFQSLGEILESDHPTERSCTMHVLLSHVVLVGRIATDNDFHLAKEVHSTVA